MALAIIAATILVSTVIVEALDLIDDAEAKKGEKKVKEEPSWSQTLVIIINMLLGFYNAPNFLYSF